MLNQDTLDSEIQKLPPLPESFTGVLAALDNEDIDYTMLEREINKDPAFSIRLLKVANSPFYGLSNEVASLKEAFLVLGLNTVRNLIVAGAVMNQFSSTKSAYLDIPALWKHSIGTGTVARVLAREVMVEPETAFTAGLLHDIGKIVLNAYFEEDYKAVVQYRDANDCLLLEAEEAVLGFQHGLVGGKVAVLWNLPTLISQAVKYHHAPDDGPSLLPLVGLVHVADIVSRGLEIGDGGDSLIPALSPNVLTRLDLSLDTIAELLPEIDKLMVGADYLMG